MKNNVVYGDCLEVMSDVKDKTFDIVVSSPPYNINRKYNTYNDNKINFIDWQVDVWNAVCKKLKSCGHLFLNLQPSRKNPLWCYDLVSRLDWKIQNTIIWNKQIEIIATFIIHNAEL